MNRSTIEAAEAAFTAGDLDRAEILSRELLTQATFVAEASHLLGAIALKRKNPQQALKWIERAIENGLINTVVLSNCGEAYRQLGRLEDAYSKFEQALKSDNTNSYAHFNLGLVMRSLGHAKESEHFFRTALALRPEMGRAHNELAELYRQEGHWAESEQEYKDALSLVMDKGGGSELDQFLQWGTRLASMLRERGKLWQSLQLLEEVLQKADYPAAHYEISKSKFELSWESAAKSHYLQATRLQPSLGLHTPPRILSSRLASIKEWCESGHGQYTFLARSNFMALPPIRTIPPSAKDDFVLGTAITPELGCAAALDVEILPRDFSVLGQGSLIVGGVVNWFQHYAQRGQLVRHEADDGRVLIDLPEQILEYDGACILLGKADDQYAWLYETLARLWVVDQMPGLTELPLVVSSDIPDERLAMLDSFGVSEQRLLRLEDHCSLKVKELHIPSLPMVGDWVSPLALQFLRRRLGLGASSERKRYFFSREGFPDRRLVNEAELLGLLNQHGFEVIKVCEKTSLELISMLRQAHAVIGIDDDAMANLVVCPQGAQIGLIATAGTYRPRAHFVCGQLAQELTYLVGETRYESNPILALCDFHLPENTLLTFLNELDKPSSRSGAN